MNNHYRHNIRYILSMLLFICLFLAINTVTVTASHSVSINADRRDIQNNPTTITTVKGKFKNYERWPESHTTSFNPSDNTTSNEEMYAEDPLPAVLGQILYPNV